jgi:hypothetical protein
MLFLVVPGGAAVSWVSDHYGRTYKEYYTAMILLWQQKFTEKSS